MVKMLAEINEQPSAITRCAQNNMDTVRELAERVKSEDIDSIVIAARGTSDHAAVYGKYVLEILTGLPVGLSAPSVYTMYHRTLRMDRCLVIGISQSGMAEDVLTVIHSAKKSGALTVSITNDAASPLAKGAHYHLDCSAGIEKSVAATKTFTTEMYLLAALAARIAGDGSITEELARLPETMSQMLNTTNDIEEKVQRYRFMDECFVLARGINYAVALEAALKIQETNYVRAKAYATSDFYHGPLALLDRNIPVVIFAPKGASFPDIARMTGKLEEMGMEMIVVSNDAETLAKGDCQLRIPDTDNDIISPYFNVIHAQLFACQLALAKGLDPDSPRRLIKSPLQNKGVYIMAVKGIETKVSLAPALDTNFIPASLWNRAFQAQAAKAGSVPAAVALERGDGTVSAYHTRLFPEGTGMDDANCFYMERLVKALLWLRGGRKIIIGAPPSVCDHIRNAYSTDGPRAFDVEFMERVYEMPFTVEVTDVDRVPASNEASKQAGRHLNGCRIGLDLGGSDRKVSAVVQGNPVYSEEVIWHPKVNSDSRYHYEGIVASLKTAAAKMPRVDAVGVSAAGIYVNNRVMAASLFIQVPEDLFDQEVKDILIDAVKELGDMPVEVANDGDVTALAGAMELDDTNVLGLAMGTSEAGGYVDQDGNITGWLNELAFAPVDFSMHGAVDEWSGDTGCGVKYFSQDAVARLALKAGIHLDESLTPAEKLKRVQELLADGDHNARKIYESIGCYLGYGLAYYADFYNIRHVLVLGRVTSGEGGAIIVENAAKVLDREFPELSKQMKLHLPDESNRRVGQSIAAASLVDLG